MSAQDNAPERQLERPLFDLGSLVAGIRWRRRLYGCLALIGLLLGVAAATVLPTRSTATTSVFIVHQDEESGDGEALMKTDLALLQTTTVAGPAVEHLQNGMTPERFLTTYSGAIIANNILEITARASNDAEALVRVQAAAESFIALRVKQSADGAAAAAKAYLDQRDKIQKDLDDVNGRIATPTSGADLQTLMDRRGALSSQIASLTQQAEVASIGSPQVAAGTKILDTPHITSRGFPLGLLLYGGVGLGAGLALGLVLAAIATIVRDRPVLRRDLVAHLGASVIAQVPAPLRGPRKLIRRSSVEKERARVAATLVRLVRENADPIIVLELRCAAAASALVKDMATELVAERPVLVVDDLPGDEMRRALGEGAEVELVDGAAFPPATQVVREPDTRRIGIASVAPGTAWTDLQRLGAEALVVLQAGRIETSWLHTVARQLAEVGIGIIGTVVVHPDPRDKTDGTVWDAMHTAIRGRLAAAGKAAVLVPPPAEPRPAMVGSSAAALGMNGVRHPARSNGHGSGSSNELIHAGARVIQIDAPTMVIPFNAAVHGNGFGNGAPYGNGAAHDHGSANGPGAPNGNGAGAAHGNEASDGHETGNGTTPAPSPASAPSPAAPSPAAPSPAAPSPAAPSPAAPSPAAPSPAAPSPAAPSPAASPVAALPVPTPTAPAEAGGDETARAASHPTPRPRPSPHPRSAPPEEHRTDKSEPVVPELAGDQEEAQ